MSATALRPAARAARAARIDPTVRRRRLLIAVFSLTNSIGYIAMIQIMPVILIDIAADLHASRTAIAGASTVSTLMGAVVDLPIGRLLDRHGGRAIMASGSLLGAGAILVWSQATGLPQLYAAMAMVGLAIVMSTYESAFAVMVVAVSAEHRNRSILAVTMFAGLATYLVYPLLGWMNTELGWRQTLVILAVALAVTGVPAHLLAIPSRRTHRATVQTHSGQSLGAVLRQGRFWLLLTAFFAQTASVSAFLLLIIAYLYDAGYSMTVASSIPIAVGVLQIVSRLVLTLAGNRLSIAMTAAVAFAIQGLGMLLLPLAGLNLPLVLLCVAAVGLGQGVSVIARPAIVADSFGVAHFASVLAALTVPMALARAGSPLFAAWLGDWRFLAVCGAFGLVGAAALVPLVRSRGGAQLGGSGDAGGPVGASTPASAAPPVNH